MENVTDIIIHGWTARRSGAAMTIEGTDKQSGQGVRITRVERIQKCCGDRLLAFCHDGTTYRLST